MSRLVQTRRGVGFHQELFQVNVAEGTAEEANTHAGILLGYVKRRLYEGMMRSPGDSTGVTFDYDDVFVMEMILSAAAACQTASHEVSP